jgi:hypothetical protein
MLLLALNFFLMLDQMIAIIGAHMNEYRNKWQTTDGQSKMLHCWCPNSANSKAI